jgi:putative SOS response-associated peptidase YedK
VCGRFADYFETDELAEAFAVERVVDAPGPSYNVAPTARICLVRDAVPPSSGAPVRELRGARWGLVPSWSKDPLSGSRLINARAETVTVKPSFRAAARSRRALIPAAGYFEWQTDAAGAKTPFFLHPPTDQPIAMAGLYEWWWPPGGGSAGPGGVGGSGGSGGVGGSGGSGWAPGDRSAALTNPVGAPGGRSAALTNPGWAPADRSAALAVPGPAARVDALLSATILTRAATDSTGQIHDRMPLIVPREAWADWLDPGLSDPAQIQELIASLPDPELIPRRVSRAVGSVKNNGPHLVAPV